MTLREVINKKYPLLTMLAGLISFFPLVCGIASIPFGVLVSMPIHIGWIGFDQNLLFCLISFGTTTSLSIGLYSMLKLENNG